MKLRISDHHLVEQAGAQLFRTSGVNAVEAAIGIITG
jgi:hypothetical protein